MDLTGKTALVTGSTSGIGLGIAHRLAAAGATLILNGFGDPAAAQARLRGRSGFHGADLSRPEEIEDLFAYAQRDFGGVELQDLERFDHVHRPGSLSPVPETRSHCANVSRYVA